MNTRLNGRVRAAVGAVVLLAGAAPALAQALGDGRSLERDLRVGGPGEASTGLTARPNFMNVVRARNAAVTGNAANGQSLQIAPPYSDPDDFRGHLGSDTLFSFRRDSLGSTAYRGGPQAQSRTSRGLWRPAAPLVTRLDSYGLGGDLPKSGNTVHSQNSTPRQRVNINPDVAPDLTVNAPSATVNGKDTGQLVTSPVGTLRSTGAITATTELNPAIVGYQKSATGVQSVTASSLLGVRLMNSNRFMRPTDRQEAEQTPDKKAMEAMGLSAAPESPKLSAANRAFRTSYEDLKDRLAAANPLATPPTEAPSPKGLQPAGSKGPEKILPAGQHPAGERTAEKPKPALGETKEPTWEERIERLRERLDRTKGAKRDQPGAARTADQDKAQQLGRPKGAKSPEPAEGEKPEPAAPDKDKKGKDKKNKYAMAGLDEETLAILRKAGGEASTYTAGAPGSLFESHLKAGEEDLAQGHYFDAEERFARALSMRPGDATVQAARLNAQVGAGLYLSAATNLRLLFQQHPEVIGVRYTGKTMPAASRLKSMLDEMRQNISKAREGKLPPPDEAGLLLAYVGYQTNDENAIRDGLAALRESKEGATDPLVPVLEGVWIGKEVK